MDDGCRGIKSGLLLVSFRGILRKSTRQQYRCDLYQGASRIPSKLDIYETEKRSLKKSICLEDVKSIEKSYDKKYKLFQLEIHCKKEKHLFYSDQKEDIAEWFAALRYVTRVDTDNSATDEEPPPYVEDPHQRQLMDENFIYESADASATFQVELDYKATFRDLRMSGAYCLAVNDYNLTMLSPATGLPEFIWPLRYVRRYGRTSTTFTLESGRKSPKGEGIYVFRTTKGDEIFDCMQKNIRKMTEGNSKFSNDAESEPSTGSSGDAGIVRTRLGSDQFRNQLEKSLQAPSDHSKKGAGPSAGNGVKNVGKLTKFYEPSNGNHASDTKNNMQINATSTKLASDDVDLLYDTINLDGTNFSEQEAKPLGHLSSSTVSNNNHPGISEPATLYSKHVENNSKLMELSKKPELVYAEVIKVKNEPWKQDGISNVEHVEHYDGFKFEENPYEMPVGDDLPPLISQQLSFSSGKEVKDDQELDDTYDRIDSIGADKDSVLSSNIYGLPKTVNSETSGAENISAKPLYESTISASNSQHNSEEARFPLYDEITVN